MFGSNVLEVGVGVTLLFLFVSLICTAVQEGIEIIFKSRAADLERGIRLLFHDEKGDGPAKTFFSHPLIYSLFKGNYEPGKLEDSGDGKVMPRRHRGGLPSYIPAANFSAALVDLVATGQFPKPGTLAPATDAKTLPADLDSWRKAVAMIGDREIQDAARTAFELAGGDVAAARTNLEIWYNGTMDRVAGWYKRRSQRSLFVLGLLIAVFLNIDAITIVRELSVNDTLRKAALAAAENVIKTPPPGVAAGTSATAGGTGSEVGGAPAAGAAGQQGGGAAPGQAAEPQRQDRNRSSTVRADYEMARAAITEVGYPVGWPAPQIRTCNGNKDYAGIFGECTGWALVPVVVFALVGWAATAFAIMLGAPFWFDVLNKFMVVRSTVKSYEKSQPEGSEDRQPKSGTPAVPS